MTDIQNRKIVDRLFNEAIEGERTYAAYFARFMRSLSKHADGLPLYEDRADFLRVAGEEVGFDPADFWRTVDGAGEREVRSQLETITF